MTDPQGAQVQGTLPRTDFLPVEQLVQVCPLDEHRSLYGSLVVAVDRAQLPDDRSSFGELKRLGFLRAAVVPRPTETCHPGFSSAIAAWQKARLNGLCSQHLTAPGAQSNSIPVAKATMSGRTAQPRSGHTSKAPTQLGRSSGDRTGTDWASPSEQIDRPRSGWTIRTANTAGHSGSDHTWPPIGVESRRQYDRRVSQSTISLSVCICRAISCESMTPSCSDDVKRFSPTTKPLRAYHSRFVSHECR